jgi:hypothetical protein
MFEDQMTQCMHQSFGKGNLDSHSRRLTSSFSSRPLQYGDPWPFEYQDINQADKQEEQNKILTEQFEHIIKYEGKSKNQIKNFHDSTILMLLFASALDNLEIPNKPAESCKCSMNSKMVAFAKQELINQFIQGQFLHRIHCKFVHRCTTLGELQHSVFF